MPVSHRIEAQTLAALEATAQHQTPDDAGWAPALHAAESAGHLEQQVNNEMPTFWWPCP